MSKIADYAAIHGEMNAPPPFHNLARQAQKEALDGWLARTLEAARVDGGALTAWEKYYLVDALEDNFSGRYLMAFNALYHATLPGQPAINHMMSPDLEAVTVDHLIAAAARQRLEPMREHPVFRWILPPGQ